MFIEIGRRTILNIRGLVIGLFRLDFDAGHKYMIDHEFNRANELNSIAICALKNAEITARKYGSNHENSRAAAANAEGFIAEFERTNQHLEDLL